jgi:magnesium-transporting ATPase (P-type)
MSEKRVVSRKIAIAVGTLCIILLVALVGMLAIYTSVFNKKDSQIADLQNQVTSDNSTINSLTAIVNLNYSIVWVNAEPVNQTAGNFSSWSFSVSYAGYVIVDILTSPTNNMSVELKYSWNGVSYDNTTSVSPSGSASFPVLPANNIGIRVINTNSSTSASETVTITYWY